MIRMLRPGPVLAVALLAAGSGPAPTPAGEFSAAYRESLRRTVELRRQRRMAQAERPVGTIVPWPSPPALIIRQTPEVHDEIRGLLRALRR
ncbi:MAG TPA: hypothetical protein VF590_09885 [Isosphaeraceae bacterium]|jgi:hypothetical protein